MRAVLYEIMKRDDGLIELAVALGEDRPKRYLASYDGSDGNCTCGGTEEELFMALSDLAHKRYGNCAVYHVELLGILKAFRDGREIPRLPVEFGTTGFCKLKPGLLRILRNKLWILLYRLHLVQPRVWVHPDYRK